MNNFFFKLLLKFFRSKKAFTMLEMSVVILILGIILIGTINFQIFTDKKSKENITTDKIARIEQAIREYFIENEKLPCPSDLTLSSTNTSYGEELRTSDVCEAASSDFSSNNLIYGGVPTKTLGLTDDYAVDAWNDRIAYVIVKEYGDSKIYLTGDTDTITIQDVSGNEITDKAIYVLVSGGKNINGVFKNGSQLTLSSSLKDSENAFSTDFNTIFVKDVNSDSFDDIVAFKEKENLIFKDDMETLPCTLKDLGELDSDWNYTSYDDCDSNGICEQGTVVVSQNECASGEISKNPENASDSGVSYKPARKCLKYGQWSDILFPCISGCGESNISSIVTNMMPTSGEITDYINLNYLKRGKLGEEITLQCIGERVGYITLECQSDGTWLWKSDDCYESEYSGGSEVCQNSELNSNSSNFTFSTTTGTTDSNGVVYGSCSSGYEVQSGGSSTIMGTCQSDGTWSFSGGPCVATTCSNSTLNSNSNNFTFSTTTGTTSVNGVIYGSCSTGYTVQSGGSSTISGTCQSDGTWSFSGGPCVLSGGACSNSTLDSNTGHFTFPYVDTSATTASGNSQWSGACASGYSVGSGGSWNIYATCNSGTWVYYGGPCLIDCQNSILNSNTGHFYFSTTTGTTTNQNSQWGSCASGYSVSSSGSSNIYATCSAGAWTYYGGPCILNCQNSTLNSNTKHFYFSTTTGNTSVGSSMYGGACATGYNINGGDSNIYATCLSDATWSYYGGPCVSSCLNSTVNSNTYHYVFTYSTTYTNSGTTLWGSCASGYTHTSGSWSYTATCSQGTWSYSGGVCGLQ